MTLGAWATVEVGHWRFGYGEGQNQRYFGNHDAGQYWLDSNSTTPVTGNFTPQFTLTSLNLNWYGAGYTLPFHIRQVQGNGWLMLRGLTSDALQTGSADGMINGSQFAGMARLLTSANSPGLAIYGWALDAGINLQLSPHWRCAVNGEGLAGELTVQNIATWDMYLTSPQIFTDPQGITHVYYSADGATWQQNVNFGFQPALNAIVGYGTHITLFAGLQCQESQLSALCGVALPCFRRSTATLSYSTQDHAVQLGYLSKRLTVSIALDSLDLQAVQHVQTQVSYRVAL